MGDPVSVGEHSPKPLEVQDQKEQVHTHEDGWQAFHAQLVMIYSLNTASICR
jgi:hypothetical protein